MSQHYSEGIYQIVDHAFHVLFKYDATTILMLQLREIFFSVEIFNLVLC